MTREVDAVVVGSGHNGLVAAAYLARAGWEVEVYERNPVVGGAVATEELTVAGFRHDTLAGFHPLFIGSAAYGELGDELGKRGLRYLNTDTPAGTAFGDGEAIVAHRDPATTAEAFTQADRTAYLAELDEFGRRAELVLRLSGEELWSRRSMTTAIRAARKMGTRGVAELLREMTTTGRGWLASWAEGPEPGLLWAPWMLHTGLAPDDAGAGLQLRALAMGIHLAGMPVPEGGGDRFVGALRRLIEDHGGRVRTGVDVTRVVVRSGRAAGVVAGDEEIRARRAVIANVTPTQLYGRLLDGDGGRIGTFTTEVRRQAQRYRYGRACMQLHLALSEPPRWKDARLLDVPVVHVSHGLDAVAMACAQASAGLLPTTPTVVCGQPVTLDPSRAPDGRWILWIQLLETPTRPVGDAAGEIAVGDGTWTPELAERFTDRAVELVGTHAPNVPEAIVGRTTLSPADLERRNINLVGGHPYAGSTQLDQSYLWRPLPGYGSHATPIDALYLCGAATHPGPGLNAASGRIVARHLLGTSRIRNVLARTRARKGRPGTGVVGRAEAPETDH